MSLSRSLFFFSKNSSILSLISKQNIFNKNFSLSTHHSAKSSISTTKIFPNIINNHHRASFVELVNGRRNFSSVSVRWNSASVGVNASANASANATTIASTAAKAGSKWPVNSHKYVGYLCLGTSVLVFGIVILGGLTRLTESGLSITEWKPITGLIPPLNQEDWEEEFRKYQDSPEFKQLNSHITLDEFKFIFFMEWSHRLLGRTIGMVFVLPSLYFIARRKVSKTVLLQLLGICAGLGFQGFIGWWMVESGLDAQQLEERRSKPTVSQYRLTLHLGTLFLIYSAMVYTGLQVLKNFKIMKNPELYVTMFKQINSKSLKPFRRMTKVLLVLTFITAMSGGLVAGLDAGLIYNTFPHMGDDYLPSTNELFSKVYSRTDSDLIWRNFLENPTLVQLNHRIFALTTFFSVLGVHLYSHRIKTLIPKNAYRTLNVAMGVAMVQVSLGICTLLWLVPVDLAAAHQAGALGLLTTMVVLLQQLRRPTMANLLILKRFLTQKK